MIQKQEIGTDESYVGLKHVEVVISLAFNVEVNGLKSGIQENPRSV